MYLKLKLAQMIASPSIQVPRIDVGQGEDGMPTLIKAVTRAKLPKDNIL